MVRDSLLQHTSTVSMSQTTNENPSPGARPPVDFLLLPSKTKMAAGGHHSVLLSQDKESSPNKEKCHSKRSLQFKRLNFLRKEVTIQTFGEANWIPQ